MQAAHALFNRQQTIQIRLDTRYSGPW